MSIKQTLENTKANLAYSKRRASALAQHGKNVVTTGVDAAQNVAAVAALSLKAAVQAQRSTLTQSGLPVRQRIRQLKANASEALVSARADVSTAIQQGYESVADRLAHVTAVSRKEQAVENKIGRKAKKMARRLAAA